MPKDVIVAELTPDCLYSVQSVFVYSECTLNVQVYDLTDDIMLNKVN